MEKHLNLFLLEKALSEASLLPKELNVDGLTGTLLFNHPEIHRRLEEFLKPFDVVLVVKSDDTLEYVRRDNFLPENGYLTHFNIASAKNRPHIEPLPLAHETISTEAIAMVEGQKQYVLEMEVAVIGVLENGVMKPQYIGTIVDFGDRTPRIDNTGRTHKTWTTGIENGGSTGASTTWMQVESWDEVTDLEMEYWVHDDEGEEVLHTPNAKVDSLKLWGNRLGEWVGNYPPEKLENLGIKEGVPFLLSTGQILFEDDGARSINPSTMPSFVARGVMKVGEGKSVETILQGRTVERTEENFTPVDPPFSYYEN